MYYVYILRSLGSNKHYVGSTTKPVEERLSEHNSGSNKWTKAHRPLKLVYYENFICKEDCLHREKFLKSGIVNRVVRAIVKEFDGSNLTIGV